MTQDVGKIIIIFGIVLVAVGLVLMFVGRTPFLGKLPGDIHVRRGNTDFYFPIATSIALSVFATLILWIISRFARK